MRQMIQNVGTYTQEPTVCIRPLAGCARVTSDSIRLMFVSMARISASISSRGRGGVRIVEEALEQGDQGCNRSRSRMERPRPPGTPVACGAGSRYDGCVMRVDRILEDGRLLTMDPARAAALAMPGRRIVAVGDGDERRRHLDAERVASLQSRTAVPGFHDAHNHMPAFGLGLAEVLATVAGGGLAHDRMGLG